MTIRFLWVAVATYSVASWVVSGPRWSAAVYVCGGALVLLNAFFMTPKGSRRWLFVSLYYLTAGYIVCTKLGRDQVRYALGPAAVLVPASR